MAIASIVLHFLPGELECVARSLKLHGQLVEWQVVSPGRIAATLECPALALLPVLEELEKLPQIINLDLVFVNYEDDIDENGFVPCPPLQTFKKKPSKN